MRFRDGGASPGVWLISVEPVPMVRLCRKPMILEAANPRPAVGIKA